MKEYTKTITVQAVQWTGENLEEVKAFCALHGRGARLWVANDDHSLHVGLFDRADVGDYITEMPDFFKVTVVKKADFQRDYKEVAP